MKEKCCFPVSEFATYYELETASNDETEVTEEVLPLLDQQDHMEICSEPTPQESIEAEEASHTGPEMSEVVDAPQPPRDQQEQMDKATSPPVQEVPPQNQHVVCPASGEPMSQLLGEAAVVSPDVMADTPLNDQREQGGYSSGSTGPALDEAPESSHGHHILKEVPSLADPTEIPFEHDQGSNEELLPSYEQLKLFIFGDYLEVYGDDFDNDPPAAPYYNPQCRVE